MLGAGRPKDCGWIADRIKGCIYVIKGCIYVIKGCIYVIKGCIYVIKECIYVIKGCIYVIKACIYVSEVSRPALGPNSPPTQLVTEALFLWSKTAL